jgi:hypothetical protein
MSLSPVQAQAAAFVEESTALIQSVKSRLQSRDCKIIHTGAIDDLISRIEAFVKGSLDAAGADGEAVRSSLSEQQRNLNICKSEVLEIEPTRLTQAFALKAFDEMSAMQNLAHAGPVCMTSRAFPGMNCLPGLGFYYEVAHPEVSSYHLGFPMLTVYLHPIYGQHMPPAVRSSIEDVPGKIDHTFSIVQACHMEEMARSKCGFQRYNLHTHNWVLPRAEVGKDSKTMAEMGIFSPLGVFEVKTGDGVPFNSMKPLEVYIHPRDGRMAFSPNNAHVGISDGIPVSSFWQVVKHDGRASVSHVWIINDYNHPYSALVRSASEMLPSSLHEHLELIKAGREEARRKTSDRLESIARLFESGDPAEAMDLFNALTVGEKNRVFFHTWNLQGRPDGIHHDFGRAAFLGQADLAQQHRSSPIQKANAIRALLDEQVATVEAMIDEEIAFFETPFEMPAVSAEFQRKEKLLSPIIAAFEAGNEGEAMEKFAALPPDDKGKIFGLTWEFKGYPIGIHPDFGRVSFYQSGDVPHDKRCSPEDRISILQLYLHR